MGLTLVLGGISSGKSGFALELAQAAGDQVLFLATGQASDPETESRIAAHQRQRPSSWRLLEEPLDIGRADNAPITLLDSVDGWVANRMEQEGGTGQSWTRERLTELEQSCMLAVEALAGRCQLIAVSSEVGQGLVSLHPYGRAYTDLLGRVNQRLAARAAEVFLVVAGIPVSLTNTR
jgi:adenosylcobinamide kinase/adenosylcobinamide-phosphate guanylyltransferase